MSGGVLEEIEGVLLHVKVTNPEDIKPVKEEKGYCITNAFTKVLLQADQPADDILPEDPYREMVILTALDNPVVVHSSLASANNPAATAANLPDPGGAVIPLNQPTPVPGTNHMWITCATYPSRIACFVTRRVP